MQIVHKPRYHNFAEMCIAKHCNWHTEDELVHGAVRCSTLSARAAVALDVNDTTVEPPPR